MTAIITITFNPALDKSVTVPELISEKKLKCSAPVYEPGGGGINVARAIKKLGGNPTAIFLAGGFAGDKIGELLSEDEIIDQRIDIAGNSRENLIVADLSTGRQYLFDMPGPAIKPREWRACLNAVVWADRVKFIVVSGSIPPGLPDDIFKRLAFIAEKKKARLIVDTSGKALQQAIEAGVYMIKPNLKELAALVGIDSLTPDTAIHAAKKLIAQGKCQVIVVSMGANGALLVTGNAIVEVPQPSVKVKSTVGAGDSLVAGIVYSLSQNYSLPDAVRFGVACGSAATMNPGTELCSRPDAERIYAAIQQAATTETMN
ncbi:MAG: 1-phosphofructokinase family hexose kinase [Bacteroidetes bacterium]|jgi:6-phosphofructokinase 2|nr:1-phosphofructokinase family hexose kinase [Bacteroidota bacterium]